MRTHELIRELEKRGYLFVTVVDESPECAKLTAVDPKGYQIEIECTQHQVIDRVVGAELWDIMFIGEESYL